MCLNVKEECINSTPSHLFSPPIHSQYTHVNMLLFKHTAGAP